MFKATLSPFYDKVYNVLDCIGFEVYFHAFPAMALDVDLPLNLTSSRYQPPKKKHK